MHEAHAEPLLHGVMAEFRDPGELLEAIARAKAEGYTKLDAYTPYPIEKVLDALDLHHSKLPLIVLGASIVGARPSSPSPTGRARSTTRSTSAGGP
jgi:hypothetical protein